MRLPYSLTIATILAASTMAHADSILIGTGLATTSGGPSLCPGGSDCQQLAQQFTLFEPVRIDQIKVAISGPLGAFQSADGTFSVNLGSELGSGEFIGSGDLGLTFGQLNTVEKVFDFSGLDISLQPGTYYLGITGGNVEWSASFASPTTTAGKLGPTFRCDLFTTCPNHRWDIVNFGNSWEIDGTAITPEPSSIVLFGTGILGLAVAVRHRVLNS
jgi:PEP-CTERM motif